MKHGLITITTAALLLTGCSGPSTEAASSATATSIAEPSNTATTTRAAPTPSPSRAPLPTASLPSREEQIEEVFLKQVRGEHPNLEFAEGDGMITIAEGFCSGYDNGATSSDINELILIGAGVAYTLKELVTIHGAGVGAFCPEHIDKLG